MLPLPALVYAETGPFVVLGLHLAISGNDLFIPIIKRKGFAMEVIWAVLALLILVVAAVVLRRKQRAGAVTATQTGSLSHESGR